MGLVDDVQTHLQSLSPDIIDGATGWPSSRRAVHDRSDQLVVFTEDAGLEPETPAPAGTMGDSALMEPAIQVRVRSGPGQSDAARAKMQEIIDVLHGVLSQTIGSTHYLRIKAQTSEPAFIGFDVRGRPEFTMSFRALRAVMVST